MRCPVTKRGNANKSMTELLTILVNRNPSGPLHTNERQLWVERSRSPLTYFAHGGHPKAGAASRPIAGKRGSYKYCTGPETGSISVGAGLPAMRPVLTQSVGAVSAVGRLRSFTTGSCRPVAVRQSDCESWMACSRAQRSRPRTAVGVWRAKWSKLAFHVPTL